MLISPSLNGLVVCQGIKAVTFRSEFGLHHQAFCTPRGYLDLHPNMCIADSCLPSVSGLLICSPFPQLPAPPSLGPSALPSSLPLCPAHFVALVFSSPLGALHSMVGMVPTPVKKNKDFKVRFSSWLCGLMKFTQCFEAPMFQVRARGVPLHTAAPCTYL